MVIAADEPNARGAAGLAPLIALCDEAVALPDTTDVVDRIKSELCRMIRGNAFELPVAVMQPHPDRYARRLLHRDPERGYSIVAMTWGPCQSTPIHDHAGMWCVEGVCAGSIDVLQYELMEQAEDERYRFEPRNSYMAGIGSAGCLIPPYEYHLIANPCDRSPAVSLHIYGGDMDHCHVFVREDEGSDWHRRVQRALSFDD
ncbi:MAG: cysteine dioxygenase family protein [Pseudomonadota bacterium]